jgi:hypothetical protein
MLRTGTFTDSSGRSFTFTPEHIKSIVANYAQRPNPPITERHDYGRAVGRALLRSGPIPTARTSTACQSGTPLGAR